MNSEGHLVCLDHDRYNPTLRLFTQEGKELSRCPYEPLQANPAGRCRFLTMCGPNVVVVDLGITL